MAVQVQTQNQDTPGLEISLSNLLPVLLAGVFFLIFLFVPYINATIAGEIDSLSYLRRIDGSLTAADLLARIGPATNVIFALAGWLVVLGFGLLRMRTNTSKIAASFFLFGSLVALSTYVITFVQVATFSDPDISNPLNALEAGFWLGFAVTIGMAVMAALLLLPGERPTRDVVINSTATWFTPYVMVVLILFMHSIGPHISRSELRVMLFTLMWIGLASSWNLIGGYTGYIDFGHSFFVGVGGYICGILMARLGILYGAESVADQKEYLWTFAQTLPVAFVGGAIFAGLIGYPTLRLKGPYFSIAMLGVLVAGREISRNDIDINGIGLTNGGVGISFLAPFSQPLNIYYAFLALAAVIFFVSLWMYRVQIGKMLKAVRDDEVGADMRGINTTVIKVSIFMIAGGFTATIGATKAYSEGYVDPNTIFPPIYHITMIMMVMLGGIGRPWGPVLGAALFYQARQNIWSSAGEQHLIVTGLLLIAIMLYMPGGILSLLDPEDRGLGWFIRTRLFGERENVFDDSASFEFQKVPDAPVLEADVKGAPDFSLDGRRVILEGSGIVKEFGGLRAVNDVSFKIHDGEIVGLLGPNGSGKTTLFNCISGVLESNAGNISVDGQDVTGQAPWRINRAGLSRTFQRLRIYGNQRVYDNLLLARRWKGVPAFMWMWIAPKPIRDKADDLIEFLKIDHVRTVLANNLSGGQQRLLEIGMTLMNDPVVVLLDEATSGVNPALVEEIKADIRRLNEERGITFFLVEHNMSFAMELCNRIYVLDYGELIAEGTPLEIQNNERVIEAYFGRDE